MYLEMVTSVNKHIYKILSKKNLTFLIEHIFDEIGETFNENNVQNLKVIVNGEEKPITEIEFPSLIMGVKKRDAENITFYTAPIVTKSDKAPIRKVVCAACKQDEYLVVGPRHYHPVMHMQFDLLKKAGIKTTLKWSQGFIDQWGKYMDRHEALLVALAASQDVDFKRNGGSGNELYSEGIY